jgi:hypothetical protein
VELSHNRRARLEAAKYLKHSENLHILPTHLPTHFLRFFFALEDCSRKTPDGHPDVSL